MVRVHSEFLYQYTIQAISGIKVIVAYILMQCVFINQSDYALVNDGGWQTAYGGYSEMTFVSKTHYYKFLFEYV